MSRSQLATEIIALIRAGVLAGISEVDDHDPWSEGQDGADWCENEISLFRDLHEIAYPYREHNLDEIADCHSVAEVHVTLQNCHELVLNELLQYCMNGGTSNNLYFNLRESSPPNSQNIRSALALRR